MRYAQGDPFAEMNRLQARLRDLLDHTYPAPAAPPPSSQWIPAADIRATPEGVTVALEVSGVALEDVHIHLQGNVVTVQGARDRGEAASEEYFVAERPFGAFSRSFALGFNPASSEAALDNGVLTITLKRP